MDQLQRMSLHDRPLRVVIAGGGVAGLETLLGLRALAQDRVDLELVAPEPYFWYRPLAVTEPFGGVGQSHHFDLATIAESAGAVFTLDQLASVDAESHVARTSHGAEIAYDALVLACGAVPRPALAGALTFRGPADSQAVRELIDEAANGDVRSIAFVAPTAGVWPLPLYELALQTAAYLERRDRQVEIALVTQEPGPLSVFGAAASAAVGKLLRDRAIRLHVAVYSCSYESGRLELVPAATVQAERAVALPRLEGIRVLGVPQDDDGFVATDLNGRVPELEDVYAVGDITQFPVKQGGLAAQQADATAEALAAWAGASITPEPFRPVLRGLLLTGDVPRYLRSEVVGGRGDTSIVSTEALWWPPGKIVGRYLAPYLAQAAALDTAPPAGRLTIPVEISVPADSAP
jgi:sulfide:quinone oxidoreductase